MRYQVEGCAIVRSRELRVEPTKEFGARSQRRHTLVFDGRQDGAADQNLAPGIALAFRLADTGDQSALLSVQASEPFFERLKTKSDLLGLGHAITSL